VLSSPDGQAASVAARKVLVLRGGDARPAYEAALEENPFR
jgi:hypothetical protein